MMYMQLCKSRKGIPVSIYFYLLYDSLCLLCDALLCVLALISLGWWRYSEPAALAQTGSCNCRLLGTLVGNGQNSTMENQVS